MDLRLQHISYSCTSSFKNTLMSLKYLEALRSDFWSSSILIVGLKTPLLKMLTMATAHKSQVFNFRQDKSLADQIWNSKFEFPFIVIQVKRLTQF